MMNKYFGVQKDAAPDALFIKPEDVKPKEVPKTASFDPFDEINKRNALLESAKRENANYVHDRSQILVRLGKTSAKVAPIVTDTQTFIERAFHN